MAGGLQQPSTSVQKIPEVEDAALQGLSKDAHLRGVQGRDGHPQLAQEAGDDHRSVRGSEDQQVHG